MKQPFSFVNFVHPQNDFEYFSGTWRPSLKRKKKRLRRILRIPGLLQVGSIRSKRTHRTTFHRHPKAFEIYYVASGRMELLLGEAGEDRRNVSIRGGQALIIPPGLPHATANENLLAQPAHYYWIVFGAASPKKTFLNLDSVKTGSLFEEMAKNSGSPLSPERSVRLVFEKLLETLSGCSPLNEIEAISLSLQIFLSVVKRPGNEKSAPPPFKKNLTAYIEENLEAKISPRQLAKESGLSLRAFGRAFKEAFGLTPHDYILREKIRAAGKYLSGTTLSVTEISHRLGFSSSAHFATAFKQFTGGRPVDFRRAPKDN